MELDGLELDGLDVLNVDAAVEDLLADASLGGVDGEFGTAACDAAWRPLVNKRSTCQASGAAAEAKLLARFHARVGQGLHSGLMQAYLRRAQELQRDWEELTGQSAVTGLELRFQ